MGSVFSPAEGGEKNEKPYVSGRIVNFPLRRFLGQLFSNELPRSLLESIGGNLQGPIQPFLKIIRAGSFTVRGRGGGGVALSSFSPPAPPQRPGTVSKESISYGRFAC